MNWSALAEEVIEGRVISNEEALSILDCHDDDLLVLLNGAFRIRKYYYGKKVKLNMIMNTKSGLCPENCGYCSQSVVSEAPIEKYRMLDKETIVQGAEGISNASWYILYCCKWKRTFRKRGRSCCLRCKRYKGSIWLKNLCLFRDFKA